MFDGDRLDTSYSARNFAACCDACYSKSGCAAFTWDAGWRDCALYTAGHTRSIRVGAVSGILRSSSAFCLTDVVSGVHTVLLCRCGCIS